MSAPRTPQPGDQKRPAGFTLTVLMEDGGRRAVAQVSHESEVGPAMREAFEGRVPTLSQIIAKGDRSDPDLQDRLKRFRAGERIPVLRRTLCMH